MISVLNNDYSLKNLLTICFQMILPIVIYLISFLYITDSQTSWYEAQYTNTTFDFLNGYKGIFLSVVIYLFVGVTVLTIMDYYYYKSVDPEYKNHLKKFFTNIFNKDKTSSIHFYLLPLMIFCSNIGFVIGYMTKTFIPHAILNIISIFINLYLMSYYTRYISVYMALLLSPLLLWQVFNTVYYLMA